MSELLQKLSFFANPETTRPPEDRLISGSPVFTVWTHEDTDGLSCGIWKSTPGKWRVSYDEWEYFRILAGTSILQEDDGHPVMLRPGDSYVIRPGFAGTWEVLVTTSKDFVVRE